MPTAQPPRTTRRLASLPARIVLFVCAATLVTAAAIGVPVVRSSHETAERALADQSLSVLERAEARAAAAFTGGGDGPATLELDAAAWEIALVDGTGRVIAGSRRGERWPLPPGGPAGLTVSDPAGDLLRLADAEGRTWVQRGRPAGTAPGFLLARRSFEDAYAPLMRLVPQLFALGFGSVFLFCVVAYSLTAALVAPIELLAEEARRISQGDLHFELSLPVRTDEVGLLTRTFNDMVRRLRRNQQQIEEANLRLTDQNQQLQQANEILAQLSITDGLTRLHNHRYFQDQLSREIKRCDRTREPLAMILADIDDFKQLNDRFGHAAGDEVLVKIAGVMNESIRETDFLARYGGEEFVILTTGTDLQGAVTLAEKIRLRVAELRFRPEDADRDVTVTLSMGVAVYRGERRAFFRDADRALYEAKDQGKNCVIVDEVSQSQ